MRARARAPKYHQYDRAIDNNNHKYLVHILGSCYCLLAGLSCRFFRYRHHKTNPIITFQFNCVKPVTLTVSRDRRQIYERGNQRAHCANASNAITMHIFLFRFRLKRPKKMTLVSHRSYWSMCLYPSPSHSHSPILWPCSTRMSVTNNKTPQNFHSFRSISIYLIFYFYCNILFFCSCVISMRLLS